MNDTVVGDPLFTVPLFIPDADGPPFDRLSLCYEIHGQPGAILNFISDRCTSVNALYTPLEVDPGINIVSSVAVRAVDAAGQCVNIRVDLDGCSASVNGVTLSAYNANAVTVKKYPSRVRISVPNCGRQTLVMWALCQKRTVHSVGASADMIKFVVARGLSMTPFAHGLIGKWLCP